MASWKFTTCSKRSRSVAVCGRRHQKKAMHHHIEALGQAAQKFERLTLVPVTGENYSERQMNIRLSPRLKLLGILTAFLGPALAAVSEEQPDAKEKWAAPAA